MSILYLLLGVLILTAGIIDLVWTTLWPDGGAGPITRFLAVTVWKFFRKLSGGNSRVISMAGPIILLVTLLSWIISMWSGWALIFASDPNAFSDTSDGRPINWAEIIYYTGYLLFTLGNGDYSPQEGIWQIISIIVTASGLIFITLGVTYLLSVLNAVTKKHALAKSIHAIGDSASDVVKNVWNGKDFRDFDLLLSSFTNQLTEITAQHKAYPILHFYNTNHPKESLPISIALLDETLTILLLGMSKGASSNRLLMLEMRSSVQSYLDTLRIVYVRPAEKPPSPPDLNILRELGMPVVSNEKFHAALSSVEERREDLLGIVHENQRHWPGN